MPVSQSRFRSAMLDPSEAVPEGLEGAGGAPAGKRFDVYRNNVAVSLTDAMETGFPVIRKLVGDEFFKAMTGVYLRLHQPDTPMLMFYGESFPGFLERFEPARALPYLADTARLELAIRESYHAADSTPAAPEALQSLPGGDLMGARLRLAPSLRVLRSRWPVYAIWAANTQGIPAPDAPRGQDVLITRPEFDPVPSLLGTGGAAFIMALAAGESFGAALAAAQNDGAGFNLSDTLGALISGGAITEVIPGEAT